MSKIPKGKLNYRSQWRRGGEGRGGREIGSTSAGYALLASVVQYITDFIIDSFFSKEF